MSWELLFKLSPWGEEYAGMLSGDMWQGRTSSRGPRGQKPGQADPHRSLGGFLKPFLGAGVDRNRVTGLQGKWLMPFP